jgi:hypothetical protein
VLVLLTLLVLWVFVIPAVIVTGAHVLTRRPGRRNLRGDSLIDGVSRPLEGTRLSPAGVIHSRLRSDKLHSRLRGDKHGALARR